MEIGCGWGGFAEYIGKKYDVKLDCITISKKQFEYTKNRIHKCGLNEKVNIDSIHVSVFTVPEIPYSNSHH